MRVALRRVLSLASLAALAACAGDGARVSVSYTGRPELPPSVATITIDAAGNTSTMRGAELVAQGYTVRSAELLTATKGALIVSYVLIAPTDEQSRGSVSLDLRRDWIWGVNITIDSLDPALMCFGCFGSKSFPLPAAYRRSARDSIWMTWGGNSIRNPVIY
jgi:hypothetical protein